MRAAGLAGLLAAVCVMAAGCSGGEKQVVIYSNADDEAVTAMKNALDNNGYKDKYIFQNFGTSELGGKLLAEGTDIEADLVTMSTFYVESAQEQNRDVQGSGLRSPRPGGVSVLLRPHHCPGRGDHLKYRDDGRQ